MTGIPEEEQRLITAIAHARYGLSPAIVPLESFNNDVYLLTFGERLPAKVIKLAGLTHGLEKQEPFIKREQAILRALGAAGLNVPPVEWTQDDCSISVRAFTLMPRLPGEKLEATVKTNPVWGRDMWKAAGHFAAQISELGRDLLPRWGVPQMTVTVEMVRRSFAKHGLLCPPFLRLLDESEALFVGERSFIHGDYAASQIITDGTGFAVIDWESGGPGYPLAMLGYFIAMQREYNREYSGNDERIFWVISGYESHTPLTDQMRHELHVWEMFAHLATMSWKIGWEPDHARHAREMAERVEKWTCL